ncbi:hypothetical protein DFH08DRAFT_425020 [Mycena albidolilacea]|uniref:Uncharacterized protein n=1 Tax=Mycena albidolilacea TaxID=1033008 RepID=A0AAD7EDQ9_9AGAR|nr:hypothetical protein DFH08DRAFT_425020 [Mycena albidolilacea]
MISCATILFLPARALSSSIHSGWNQCSFGTSPKDTPAVALPMSFVISLRGRKDAPLKILRERLLVQKHPGIGTVLIELVLHLPHARERASEVRVAREHEEGGVCARAAGAGVRVRRVRGRVGRGRGRGRGGEGLGVGQDGDLFVGGLLCRGLLLLLLLWVCVVRGGHRGRPEARS